MCLAGTFDETLEPWAGSQGGPVCFISGALGGLRGFISGALGGPVGSDGGVCAGSRAPEARQQWSVGPRWLRWSVGCEQAWSTGRWAARKACNRQLANKSKVS